MKNTVKKFLSIILIILMIATTLPIAFAENTTYEVGDTVQFGSYPQSRVTDEALIAELNTLAPDWDDWTSYDYYSSMEVADFGSMKQGDWMKCIDVTYNGEKYRGVKFIAYRPYSTRNPASIGYGYSYQYNNGYYINTVYWFKFEPIDWQILDPSTGLVMCETIIDSQPFSNTIYLNDNISDTTYKFFNDSSYTNYTSDYETSAIRQWLNYDFYNTAFTVNDKNEINITTLNNDGRYTSNGDTGYEILDSNPTSDKIFLLSFNEVRNSDFGFSSNFGDYDTSRQAKGSDYAKSQGFREDKYSYWILRSPGVGSYYCCYVNGSGGVYGFCDVNGTYGVRPALRLNYICVYDHTHSYESVITLPTCTESGTTTYTCACGDSYTETLEPTGHTFDGSVCTACGYDKADECDCRCHNDSFFAKLIWNIINFFNRLLRKNQECNCGITHY